MSIDLKLHKIDLVQFTRSPSGQHIGILAITYGRLRQRSARWRSQITCFKGNT